MNLFSRSQRKKTLVAAVLIAAFLLPGTSVSAADKSPNAIPGKGTSPSSSQTTGGETSSSSSPKVGHKKNRYGIDFSNNVKPAKAKKKVNAGPSYGLKKDGSYVTALGTTSYRGRMETKDPVAKPGAKRQTKTVTETVWINGKGQEITYKVTEQIITDDSPFKGMWQRISPDPSNHVPVGYALAAGYLTLEDLPADVYQWVIGGGYDYVSYWPCCDDYTYALDIPLELAENLSLLDMNSLSSKEQTAYKLGSRMTYMPLENRVYESGMPLDVAISAGLVTESQVPAEAKAARKNGSTIYFSYSTNRFGWASFG